MENVSFVPEDGTMDVPEDGTMEVATWRKGTNHLAKPSGKTVGEMVAEVHTRMSMFAPQINLPEFWSIVAEGLDIKPGDIFNPETDAKFAVRLREFNEASKNVAFIKLNVNDPGKVATYLVQAGRERLLVQLWFAAHKASLRPSVKKTTTA